VLEERGGWGKVYPLDQRVLRKHPHPTLPREERERERTSVAETTQSNLILPQAIRLTSPDPA
jgi:hypothetical protein